LLAALAIPGFVKARKQSQGRRVINDARQMDAAIDQWAKEKGKKDGDSVVSTEAATYLKGEWKSTDLLGNSYSIGTVGTNQLRIHATTKSALDGVGIDWGQF
jgi:type II secretory pathway pseudopilin PulG